MRTPQETLRQKINETCPELFEGSILGFSVMGTPHLEHLLRTLDLCSTDPQVKVSVSSNMMRIESYETVAILDLTKPPLEQSPETITNLLEILR